jgi:hypothetical protein
MSLQDESEAPLDPAQERLRRKLVRLLLISGGIMLFGFIAVFASIIYKLSEREDADTLEARSEVAGELVEARIPVPPGARLLSAELDGDRALLRVEALDGRVSLILVDLASGSVLGRYAVEPE